MALRCPLREGNTVRVSDASHHVLAEGRLGEPETTRVRNVERCRASFEIDGLPRSESYAVQVANAAPTYSHEDLSRLG